MFLTVHFIIAAAIKQNVKNLPLSLVLIFLSHYLLDALPHRDYSIATIREKKWRYSLTDFLKIFLDLTLGGILVGLITEKIYPFLIPFFVGILPDIFDFVYIFLPSPLLKKHQALHKKIHSDLKNHNFWKIFFPAAISITGLLLL